MIQKKNFISYITIYTCFRQEEYQLSGFYKIVQYIENIMNWKHNKYRLRKEEINGLLTSLYAIFTGERQEFAWSNNTSFVKIEN